MELQANSKLKELVAADTTAAQAFVEQRQRMARESQEVAQRL
jgi:hypothetical protein